MHLESDLGCRILHLLALVSSQLGLLLADLLRLLGQRRNGRQVKVRVEMPKEGTRDADEGTVGELGLALLDDLEGALVDDDLVVAGLDEAAGDVLDLLAGLDEEVVARRDLHGDAGARVAGPDVEAGVAGAAVDGEEVEVGVEAGENGVFGAVLGEVGGGWSEEMGAVGVLVLIWR